MENITERARRSPRKSKKNSSVIPVYRPGCRCGFPIPSQSGWHEIHFDDKAVLYVSAEQFFLAGNCPVAAIGKLIDTFNLDVEGGVLVAPFPFSEPDRSRVSGFLYDIMRLSISDYDRRAGYEAGLC
ncbi:MAG: hypothetical protein WBX25_29070 [Rhodomicrobium sp.]